MRKSQLCNNPGTAGPEALGQSHWYRPAYGSSGLAPRHDLDDFAPAQLLPWGVPLVQDRPG